MSGYGSYGKGARGYSQWRGDYGPSASMKGGASWCQDYGGYRNWPKGGGGGGGGELNESISAMTGMNAPCCHAESKQPLQCRRRGPRAMRAWDDQFSPLG